MKPSLMLLLLGASLVPAMQVRAITLPDSCGDDKVRFDVKTEKSIATPAPPADGKAQIVFIETLEKGGATCIGCDVTTRIGLDGAWVGANKGNSYFTLDVSPGEHHVCVAWQSASGKMRKKLGLDFFVAAPGNIYYYRATVKIIVTSESYMEQSLKLRRVSDDEGKYLLKTSELSSPNVKK